MQSQPGGKAEPRSQRMAAGGSSASQRPAAMASWAASHVARLVAATVSWRSADHDSKRMCGSKARAAARSGAAKTLENFTSALRLSD